MGVTVVDTYESRSFMTDRWITTLHNIMVTCIMLS